MTAIVPDRKWSEDQGRHIPVRADERSRAARRGDLAGYLLSTNSRLTR
jgi:hypothetical protein